MSVATCKAGRAKNVCEMYSIVHILGGGGRLVGYSRNSAVERTE